MNKKNSYTAQCSSCCTRVQLVISNPRVHNIPKLHETIYRTCYNNTIHGYATFLSTLIFHPPRSVLKGGWGCHFPLWVIFSYTKYMIKQWKYIYRYRTWSKNSKKRTSSLSKNLSTPLHPPPCNTATSILFSHRTVRVQRL